MALQPWQEGLVARLSESGQPICFHERPLPICAECAPVAEKRYQSMTHKHQTTSPLERATRDLIKELFLDHVLQGLSIEARQQAVRVKAILDTMAGQ